MSGRDPVMRITFHPDAGAEVTEAVQYYEVRSLCLGGELLAEVERALGHNREESRRLPADRSACPPQDPMAFPL